MIDDAWVLEAATDTSVTDSEETTGDFILAKAFVDTWLSQLDHRFVAATPEELKLLRYGALCAIGAWCDITATAASVIAKKENKTYQQGIAWAVARHGIMAPSLQSSLARKYVEDAQSER
jgi:hypothetical protein